MHRTWITLLGIALVAGCGGGSTNANFTGSITMSASGSWSYVDNGGSTNAGTEMFQIHCTNNGSGTAEFSGSITTHLVITDPMGKTSTTDGTGTTDQTNDTEGCVLGIDDGRHNLGVSFAVPPFDVTGATVAGGVSVPINGDWSRIDFASAGGSADAGFVSIGESGMLSFTSGDLVGGDPTMVVSANMIPTGIPETISWSFTQVR